MKVLIIGGGHVGAYIANILVENHCDVKIIEYRDNVLAKLKNDIPDKFIIAGSGTDPNILDLAGINNADVVIAVTGSDETNLVAATIAKFEFDVPRVIARVNNPKNTWLFNSGMGVDVALNQADLMAHLVVEEMNLDTMLTLMKISRGNYSIVQFKVSEKSAAVRKSVKDLPLPKDTILFTIYKGKNIVIPRGDTIIEADDIVLAFTDKNSQEQLNTIFSD